MHSKCKVLGLFFGYNSNNNNHHHPHYYYYYFFDQNAKALEFSSWLSFKQ